MVADKDKITDYQNDHDLDDKERGKEGKRCRTDSKERGEKEKGDYFAKCKEEKMTVIFHAVLAPHFKFEESQGDKIFMRFGGAPFGFFNHNVVEVHPER